MIIGKIGEINNVAATDKVESRQSSKPCAAVPVLGFDM
ncbi:hypothetical protein ABI_43870 [Asticcacaulis biprosthecium C19]|uniref:Uncharacterized protein n=1 Tax=Asticcacaulis biprosthecium C19 TaxID=715226 RepID=F4QT90_9CAUL|nr:hypothetical protein ABI_43870 [Asticcacaulis biprosthecium C19]